ncbi:MAG TPA: radical SAM protein, partial [Methanoregulaceae archaeon]|nr:radical SAM protein [Methanoregulaceae archaeon]
MGSCIYEKISIMMTGPVFLRTLETGELEKKAGMAIEMLSSCNVCPRQCGVDRVSGERGYCRGGFLPKISSHGPHFGEEPPLVGRHGSGTIFFTGCNMKCRFCQNSSISQQDFGSEISCEKLAAIMLALQDRRCHNINLVSPSHFVPQILNAVYIAAKEGLKIPLVYNTGTYDSVETLRLLDGVVDIYMPDAKYGDNRVALELSDAPNYFDNMKGAILEMQRQVGDLEIVDGIATRGLLIRHLVLPDDLAGSEQVMEFIAEEVSKDAYVNVMDQYRWCRAIPEHEFVEKYPGYESLLRGITNE